MERVMKRIAALDLLRGYFLCVIAIDHLYRFPNALEIFTGRGQLWVSAAEGFFMISGMLVGFIYGPKILLNTKKTVLKIWARAGKLYLISGLLTIGFTVWGRHMPVEQIKSGLWAGNNLGEMIWETLTLKYVYGWADFLAYYAVFMAFAPLAVYAAAKKKGWVVMVVSVGLWLARGNSFYLAWQLLFMSSVVAGSNLMKLEIKKITGWTVVTAVTMLLSVMVVFGGEFSEDRGFLLPVINFLRNTNATLSPWFDKSTLGPGRVILAGVWFTTLLAIFRKYEVKIQLMTRGVFEKMGRNSLLVYCLHAVVVFPMNVILPHQVNFWENTALTAAVLGLIYMVVVIKEAGGSKPSIIGGYENMAEVARAAVFDKEISGKGTGDGHDPAVFQEPGVS